LTPDVRQTLRHGIKAVMAFGRVSYKLGIYILYHNITREFIGAIFSV